MSMELTKLEFVVDTKQLENAVKELGNLRQAISELNTVQTKKTKGEKEAEAQAKALAKAEKEAAKEVERLAKETEKKAAADAKAAKAAQDATEKVDPLDRLYGKLSNRLTDLVAGFSSSEAAILHQARSYGAAGAELDPFIEKLKETRDFLKNPFDASLGSIQSITAEFQKLEQRAGLAAQGIVLTTKQLNEYSKLSSQVWQETKGLGLDPSKGAGQAVFNRELEKQQAAYLKVAAAVNTATGSEKELARTKREGENATRAVAREEEKMLSILASVNAEQRQGVNLNEAAAQSVARYEQNLKRAGITGEQAAKKLELYKNQQSQVIAVEQKRQAQYLSRGLQPQIGDVVVSLAAGQNPLTVMLQQGDQIRGLIAQTGVEGALLKKTMQDAFTQTIASVKNTAVAIGSVLGGAITSVGKQITGLVTGPIVAFSKAITDSFKAGGSATASLGGAFASAFSSARLAALAAVPTLIASVVTALAAYAVSLYQVSRQEDELSKSLVLTGGSLGLSQTAAIDYARSLNDVGISTSKAVDVITAMAKAGSFTASEIKMVTVAAVEMQKSAGIAIEDTVKQFAKLKEKPVEAIIELAKATGTVSPAVLEAISALERQGKTAEAAALAMKTGADVMSQQAARIKGDLSDLGAAINWFGSLWGKVWDGIKGLQYKVSAGDALKEAIENKQKEIQRTIDNLALLEKIGITPDRSKLEVLQKQSSELSRQLLLMDNANQTEQDRNASNIEAANSQADRNKLAEKLYKDEMKLMSDKETRQGTINRAIAEEYRNRKNAASVTQEEIAQISRLAGLEYDVKQEKKPKSKEQKDADKAQRERNQALETYNDLLGRGKDLSSSYNEEKTKLDLLLSKGKINQGEYNLAFAELIKKQPVYIQQQKELTEAEKERAKGQELINSLLGKGDDLGKDYYKSQDILLDMLEKSKDGYAELAPKILLALAALEATTPAAKKAAEATKALAKAQADLDRSITGVNLQRAAVTSSYDTDFKTEEQKAAMASLSKYEKSIAEADADYKKSKEEASTQWQGEELNKRLENLQLYSEARKALAKDEYNREVYLQSDTYKLYAAGFTALTQLSKDFGNAVGDSFVDMFKTGDFSFVKLRESFKDMIDSMVANLIKLQIQKQISGLLDFAISAGIDFLTGGSAAASPSFNTSALTNPLGQAKGGAWESGLQAFAKGGSFTNSIVDSPTMFKFAKGTGLMGEAGPEAIMPLRRDSSGSLGVVASGANQGSNVEVVVNNYGSEKATTNETVDSRGNRKIEVTIGDMAAAEIGRSGSSSQKALGSAYGMRPQLIRR